MADNAARPKIAILGSGVGAMTAAYELAVQDKYDITVYQMGWRLGGQGASGRNLDDHARIEEHGLHVWFGFYYNAFALMRRCYADLGRPPDAPLATAEKAFVGQDTFMFRETYDGQVRPWEIHFPADPGVFPGGTGASAALPEMHVVVTRLLENAFGHFSTGLAGRVPVVPAAHPFLAALGRIGLVIDHAVSAASADVGRALFEHARVLLGTKTTDQWDRLAELLRLVRAFARDIAHPFLSHDEPRRVWSLIDLVLTIVIGILKDRIISDGFDVINHKDFREWLTDQGADPLVVNGPLIAALYDIFFAYEGGDVRRPNVEAGNALRGSLRTMLTYQGHVLWKMKAGMGDTVFAPLYLALKKRGVAFKFFHEVTCLHYDDQRGTIGAIDMGRQVDLTVPEYSPLVDVKGLPCWPSAPLVYTSIHGEKVLQIADGDKLEGVNLESRWSGWTNVSKVTLREGIDFDHVVLGITVSGLQFICDEKLKALGPWQQMLAKVQTVRTQAVQLWFNRPSGDQVATTPTPPPPPPGLGTPVPNGIIANCTEPDACWADFNQVLNREDQPADVLGLFYGCGVLPDRGPEFPPPDDLAFPAEELARVRETTVSFLRGSADQVWPRAAADGTIDWSALAAPEGEVGEARLDSQYLRANVDPSERYVLSLVNTSRFRLKAGDSGVKNLFLAGSWVDNGNNLSCVEAAAMSGMQASRAISGLPSEVFGEHGFPEAML